jgi:glycosyltransferase involved in cell wall biosynthesis
VLVSICIPTYSRPHYLKEAVASAKAQTYPNIEICVAQNPAEGGPDPATKEWCLEQQKLGIIKYSINEDNLGLTGNLNRLAEIASGEYVVFLGDDDLLAPTFIASAAEKIYSTKADILFTNQFFIDENGEILEEVTMSLNSNYKRDELKEGIINNTVELVFNNSVPLSASVIKKDLFAVTGFNENLNTPELPFFLMSAIDGKSFFYINKQLAYYRLHKNSETFNGLTAETLLKEIIGIHVPPEYEKLKSKYVSNTAIPAINKALLKGDVGLAKFLLRSEYYPRQKIAKLIQWLMCYIPTSVLKQLFKLRKAF